MELDVIYVIVWKVNVVMVGRSWESRVRFECEAHMKTPGDSHLESSESRVF